MNTPVKKILCPVDFSEHSERALKTAVGLAKQNEAELVLLSVVQPLPTSFPTAGTIMSEVRPLPIMMTDASKEHLEKMLKDHCGEILDKTTAHVTSGVPFVEIVRYAREIEADLIVMGSHGRTGLEHLLIGSVAERVVRKAPCSVLVVRDGQHPFKMP